MRRWTKCIAVALAWALCLPALADQPDPWRQSRPLKEAELARLRGGLAAPALLQQVGVILWDEPRKVLPPLRNGAVASNTSAANTTSTVNR